LPGDDGSAVTRTRRVVGKIPPQSLARLRALHHQIGMGHTSCTPARWKSRLRCQRRGVPRRQDSRSCCGYRGRAGARFANYAGHASLVRRADAQTAAE
jgi:hypothetical protein